jgi:hypothetical protein
LSQVEQIARSLRFARFLDTAPPIARETTNANLGGWLSAAAENRE